MKKNKAIKKQKNDCVPNGQLMTTAEVAGYLRITPQHVTRLCRRKEIPHVKLGRKLYRFRKEEVIQWVRQSAEPSALEK